MTNSKQKKLRIKLSDQQLEVLRPLLQQTGTLKLAGEVEDGSLNVSFLACNAAFLACNAAFSIRGQMSE
jgi:hypothetical protein